jgi:hypothetical protein
VGVQPAVKSRGPLEPFIVPGFHLSHFTVGSMKGIPTQATATTCRFGREVLKVVKIADFDQYHMAVSTKRYDETEKRVVAVYLLLGR